MFASGIVALIVGFLILFGWPDTANWLLGLELGFNFLTTGVALILLGRALQDPVLSASGTMMSSK
ncbi:hypothetical protein [Litorivita sp. NS0012-18]|uniref:hypothetical protein n=1 Tax=Litorivita sp. NS0012-18 TaxID=3127655 RepID=UPI00310AFABC